MTARDIRLVIITSDHRRHRWVAARLAAVANLVGIVAESKPTAGIAPPDPEVRAYFNARRDAEDRWFENAAGELDCQRCEVAWGGSNSVQACEFVTNLAPDLVVLFGSSIIKDPLLGYMKGRIINMHLGLSPYYRGSATNFWPLVDNLPECVGVTIHHPRLASHGGLPPQSLPASCSAFSMTITLG